MNITQNEIQQIIFTIKNNSNYNFEDYSIKSLTRRIEKTLFDFKLDVPGLIDKMEKQPEFITLVSNNLTVNTTELFRDPQIWQTLRHKILNKLSNKRRISIWHAGCSTGQEVYSMLILLNELDLMDKVNIFATDLNQDVIDKAKAGEYSYRFNPSYFNNFEDAIRKNSINKQYYNNIPYSRYFEVNKVKKNIQFHENLRKKPVWLKHDLTSNNNIFDTKFDLIMCRNVLIYFNISLQFDVIDGFYNKLYDNAYLVLGLHESIMGPMANNFIKKGLFYIKK